MSQAFTADDEAYMARALRLAARGRGRVEPNPMVGCVIVRSGRIVGEGYHRRFGGPHAEVDALRDARRKAKGATAYVTLEPCCHQGKTPPCTGALIDAGITRVVIAMRDKFPPVGGKGFRVLRSADIRVATGLGEAEARELNAPYIKLRSAGRPYVILKWAQSLDGKIATRTGDSRWISCEQSRKWVHRLRARVDGVLVGVGTVLADDPQLTCRHGRPRRPATRIVVDPNLRTPIRAKLVQTAGDVPTLLATSRRQADSDKARKLQRTSVEILPLPVRKAGLDLGRLLDALGRREMTNILVEGGGKTIGRFVDAGLADEAAIFVAPRLIGGQEAPSPLAGLGPKSMQDIVHPATIRRTRVGIDDLYQLRLTTP